VLFSATPNYSHRISDPILIGTSPTSGIALLASALEHMMDIGSMVLCTTHFLELFSMNLLNDDTNGIRALRMAILVPDNENVLALPLFCLERGVASSSAGLVCAKMAGMKTSVLDRASEIISAVRECRQVCPLREIFMNEIQLSDMQQRLLGRLVLNDWMETSEADIDDFLSKVHDTYCIT
jgi:DNA mismatch repair ATPase MutS